MMPVDRTEYENVVEKLVEDHPTAVRHDPIHVASSVIAGFDRSVDPDSGCVRTHGTDEFLNATLYPGDVVAISSQSQMAVNQRYAESHSKTIYDESIELYAIYTMLLDLEDALQDQDGEDDE